MADKIASVLGGDKWKGIIAKSLVHNVGLKVGILESADNADTDTLVAEYAFYNEFGISKKVQTEDGETKKIIIPARPFMRNTVEDNQAEWAKATAALLEGKTTQPGAYKNAFGKLGAIAKADIQKTIQSGMTPDNAPSTKKHKKQGRTTLQDSFDLFNAIGFEVTDSKGKSI